MYIVSDNLNLNTYTFETVSGTTLEIIVPAPHRSLFYFLGVCGDDRFLNTDFLKAKSTFGRKNT